MSNKLTVENADEINNPIKEFLTSVGFELKNEEPLYDGTCFKYIYEMQLTEKIKVQAKVAILGIVTSYHHNISLETLTKTRYGDKWDKNYLKICNDLDDLKKYLLEEK